MEELQIKTYKATKVNKTSRNIIKLFFIIKRLLNVPERRIIIKVKSHEADFDKKPLTKSIVTEIITREGIQTINVKTDIDFRFLCKM